jgi:hypothetical protein
MLQPKGKGLILEPVVIGKDYVFGGHSKLSGEVINPSGDWLPHIPKFEHQAPSFETSACATFGTLNAFEILHKFIFGVELNLSDRFVAKGSNTDPAAGNSPNRVSEWFRKKWSVYEEDWPMDGVRNVEDYYAEIPSDLLIRATGLKGQNVWGYEFVNPSLINLLSALRKGVVGMSVALIADENGLYYKPAGWRDSHWVTLLNIRPNGNYTILDSYAPYIKEVRADFVSEYALRYTLNEEKVDWIIRALDAIKKALAKLLPTTPTPKPEPKPEPKPAPANNLLNALALAHQKHEGGKPHHLNMRLNNPGACRFSSVGYLPKYGNVKEHLTGNEKPGQRGFAHFPTYELGFLYLKNLILEKARKHPDWNLLRYIGDEREGWAPASDNNMVAPYAKALAAAIGVSEKTWKIGALLA